MVQYRKTLRANFLSYDVGDYFVTICTKDKMHYFGEILRDGIDLSKVGLYADKMLGAAQTYCDYITVPGKARKE